MAVAMACACKKDTSPSQTPASEANAKNMKSGAWFDVRTEASGLGVPHVGWPIRRFDFPELIGAGVCMLDYDNDGWLDVYQVQGGDVREKSNAVANTLHRNRGDGTFEDVSASTGVADRGYGMGCAVGDYDADGDVDLYVTNVGQNRLYRNEGNGRFLDVTRAAGMQDGAWSTSAAFVDLEADGDLDLVVANYIVWSHKNEVTCYAHGAKRDYCGTSTYDASAQDRIYRNLGNGRFEDASESFGITAAFGNGLGVAVGDFNGDGFVDLYVANDANPNQLWIWDAASKRFREDALLTGCALNREGIAEAGMGIASIDVDQDGDLDLFVSHLRGETNTLYINNDGMFSDVTARFGLSSSSTGFTGFGLGFVDFDHDSILDLFVANGRVEYEDPLYSSDDPYVEPNLLYAGRADGTFVEIAPQGGTADPLLKNSRGAAFGDIDNDGDIDIVIRNTHAAPDVLLNTKGQSKNWITFDVRNPHGSPAVGATVRITAPAFTRTGIVRTVVGYCSASDPRVHFGLGELPAIDEVLVKRAGYPDYRAGPYAAGQIHRIDLK
jgi:hypothetical protein